jgi:membrane protein
MTAQSSVGATQRPALSIVAVWKLLRDSFLEWQKVNAPRLAAALAYYAIFSLAPIFIIALAVAGLILGPGAARGELVKQVQQIAGEAIAEVVQSLIENIAQPNSSVIATVVSVGALVIAATGLFAELHAALNLIWNVQAPESKSLVSGILVTVRSRLLAFAMVLGGGAVLLVTFVLDVFLSAIGNFLQHFWSEGTTTVLQVLTFVVTFVLLAAVFAIVYRVLPDTTVTWRDVWLGAAFTSLVFNIGRLLIGLYLSRATFGSVYGAAGSFIVLLIWVYYSAQIFYMGAEFTHLYACRHGSHFSIVPAT